MKFTNEDISKYLDSLDINEENALDFYRSSIRGDYNTPQGFVFRKILSQLEVRHHVENLDLAVGQYRFGESCEIIRSALRGETHYTDKMIEFDRRPKPNYRCLNENVIGSVIESKKFDVEQSVFSLPSKIKVLQDKINSTPKNEKDKIRLLNSQLDTAKAQLQRADQQKYSLSNFGFPMEQEATAEWKDFLDSNISQLKSVVGEYVENIANIQDKELSQFTDLTTASVGDFLLSQASSNRYIDNFKADVAMHFRLLKFVYQNKDVDSLDEIISGIRRQFDTDSLSSSIISTDSHAPNYYRQNSLNGDKKFWKDTATPQDIPEKMEELGRKFGELSKIEDEEEYKRGAVGIYKDFIQIHPFGDGNGRTSRYLLDYMFVKRGIMPPVLYDTYYDRRQLDYAMDEDIRQSGKDDTLLKFIDEGIGGRRQPRSTYRRYNYQTSTEIGDSSFDKMLDSKTEEDIEKVLQRQINEQELDENYSMTNPEQRKSIISTMRLQIEKIKNSLKALVNKNEKDKNGKDEERN